MHALEFAFEDSIKYFSVLNKIHNHLEDNSNRLNIYIYSENNSE